MKRFVRTLTGFLSLMIIMSGVPVSVLASEMEESNEAESCYEEVCSEDISEDESETTYEDLVTNNETETTADFVDLTDEDEAEVEETNETEAVQEVSEEIEDEVSTEEVTESEEDLTPELIPTEEIDPDLMAESTSGIPITSENFGSQALASANTADKMGNRNGILDDAEQKYIVQIYIRDSYDVNEALRGAEKFEYFSQLYANRKQDYSLDLSKFKHLITVCLWDSPVTDLNLKGCTTIERLVVNSNSISAIDLSDCTGLKELDLSGTNITEIDMTQCASLRSLDGSFNNCNKLATVIFPPNLRTIGSKTFSNNAITVLNIPEGVNFVTSNAISGKKLEHLTFPASMTLLGNEAFNCPNLVSLTFKSDAFGSGFGVELLKPDNLSVLNVPCTIPYREFFKKDMDGTLVILSHDFDSDGICINCKIKECSHDVDPAEPYDCPDCGEYVYTHKQMCGKQAYYKYIGHGTEGTELVIMGKGAIADIGGESYLFPVKDTVTKITISDDITSIPAYAFSSFKNVKTVHLPKSCVKIGYGAFAYCESLEEIYIPENVTVIGAEAFADCHSLRKITINNAFTVEKRGTYGTTTIFTHLNQTVYLELSCKIEGFIQYIDETTLDGTEYTITLTQIHDFTDDLDWECNSCSFKRQPDKTYRFCERLYTCCLGRRPDDGISHHYYNLKNGRSGSETAADFFFSKEFISQKTSNEEYVKRLYRTLFDREPSKADVNYWVHKLENGSTRAEIFNLFVNSPEWKQVCDSYGIYAGGSVNNLPTPTPSPDLNDTQLASQIKKEQFVKRLYSYCLGRTPDAKGLEDWTNKLVNKQISGPEIARKFFFSKEFTSRNYSDEEYIKRLYKTFMDRDADQAGLTYWKNKMKNGATREDVFNGFVNSKEYIGICDKYDIMR